MNDRIKEVRNFRGLKQDEFAKRLGVTKSAISGYETGRRAPTDSIVRSICREFQINEEWLRFGVGEMEAPGPLGILSELAQAYDMNKFEIAFLDRYLKLSQEDRQGFCHYVFSVFGDVVAKLSQTDLNALDPSASAAGGGDEVFALLQKSPVDMTDAEIDAVSDKIRQEMHKEKEAAAESSVTLKSTGLSDIKMA